ncbi:polygalacturonase 1 beta-like protein 2 [Silene latifolia]|uniref:polygalacturonase 1 beta-like protein 2 n=1 Tax=Silene latifolia TaxID=37657 RepID=UPI003D7728E1
MSKLLNIYLFLVLLSLYSHVSEAEKTEHSNDRLNPFTAKASLIRYWNNHISNNIPKPAFLLSKASPLNALDTTIFTQLASQHSLKTRLSSFCKAAHLFCEFDTPLEIDNGSPTPPHHGDSDFTSYNSKQFSTYGKSKLGGVDSFKNYSSNVNMPVDSFTRYSPASAKHTEAFTNYANNGNVANDSFTNYGTGATGGLGEFNNYESNVNVPILKFGTYSFNGNHHKLSFGTYTENTNSGTQDFTSYGKNGNAVPTEFKNYGQSSNIVGSTFASYGELANAANDSFKGYSPSANNPHNMFKNYGAKVTSGVESFENYRDEANVGDDTFQNYIRDSSSTKASFMNYGKSFNGGTDRFKNYGKGSVNRNVEFKVYGVNNSFKGYDDKKGISFGGYSQNVHSNAMDGNNHGMIAVNKLVEEGKFFRESMLNSGTVMKMPDIKDKMPKRSFLPRSISSKLPFLTSGLAELRDMFQAKENSTLERLMVNALSECERPASPGETKRCVASIEDMIDFAASVLGDNLVVRSTENVNGSGERVVIGSVKGINGGKVTKSVSCHQSLLPYLLYYCHSVPKVRVYEADILDFETKAKINHGVAICHLDTSAWSPGHGAFLALGSKPGLIEVCHWIFENDMTWAMAD